MIRRAPDRTTYTHLTRVVAIVDRIGDRWLAALASDVKAPEYATRAEAEARVERELGRTA